MRFPSPTTILLSLALALGGCVSSSKPVKAPREQTQKKSSSGGKKITMDELTDSDTEGKEPRPGKRPSKTAKARKGTPPTSPLDSDDPYVAKGEAPKAEVVEAPGTTKADCQAAFTKQVAAYQRLYALLPANTYQTGFLPMDRTLGAKASACDDPITRRGIMDDLLALQQHTGRIGAILPLSGTRAKLASYVVNGFRAGVREAGMNFEELVLIRDSGGMARNAESRLAELVLKERVGLVIGGLEKAEAEALAAWAGPLGIPMTLLTRDRDLVAKDDQLFRLYPDEKRLAETLVAGALQRGYKRVAMIRPQGGKSDKLSDHFRKALKERGGAVIHDLVYTPDNFESMSAIGRTLFQTEAAERRDEYRRAYKRARDAATKQGVPFDPRMVVLKPIVDFDAVFLPDDFRTVRHFAKLFKFHMVDKLPMIGNHEWRSPALIQPFDPFLENSIFADFIGSYSKLPSSISAPTLDSPYFVAPQNVVPVDFNLIGYRAGRVAAAVARAKPVNRKAVRTALVGTGGSDLGFGSATAFDADRQGAWPTFLFSVQKERVNLEQDPVLPAVTTPQPQQPQQALTKGSSSGWIPHAATPTPRTASTAAPGGHNR